jgi:thiamine-monophosphate kinase
MQTLIDLGERRILQTIIPQFVTCAGDDCAVIELPIGQLIATTDPVPPPAAASIGKDDDLFWMGWLLVTINASDLAAAAASPLGFLAAIECEATRDVSAFERLLKGIRAACDDAGLAYVGGNIREAPRLGAVGVGLGLCHPYPAVTRKGARDGDLVFSIGSGGVFWRDALRMLDGRGPVPKESSPLYKPRSQLHVMHHLASKGLVAASMDNSDGLLPTLSELAAKNALGIEIDVPLMTVPDLNDAERPDQARMWLGWGDWNVIASISPQNEAEVLKVVGDLEASAIRIGQFNSGRSGVVLRRGDMCLPAPRLESERFAPDSWMLKGIGEYVRLLRSVPLP